MFERRPPRRLAKGIARGRARSEYALVSERLPMSTSTVPTERVLEALRQVIDPELGVNIVDLGLVYGIAVEDGRARITMTLTTPGCPMGDSIAEAADTAVSLLVPGVDAVDIDLVWDPPWCFECITEAGREELGWR